MSNNFVTQEHPLGYFKEAILARATDDRIRDSRTSGGGAVTAILAYMIDTGLVDGVITARKVKGLKAELIIARRKEDVFKAAGNRWNVVPYTTKLKDVLEHEDIKKVAIVGLPCQAQFLWHMRTFPLLETDFINKIKIIISLFCMGTFAIEAFIDMLKQKYNIDPELIHYIGIEKDNLKIIYDNNTLMVPLKESVHYMQTGCLLCNDYTGVFSDISAGISELHPGYTLLLIRNNDALRIIEDAKTKNYIEYFKAGSEVIEEVEIKAKGKIIRAQKYMDMYL